MWLIEHSTLLLLGRVTSFTYFLTYKNYKYSKTLKAKTTERSRKAKA